MKVFGMKQREPTDADRTAAARLSAVAARFKRDQSSELTDLTESAPDPLGEPAVAEPEAPSEWQASGIADAPEEPQAPEDSGEPQQ